LTNYYQMFNGLLTPRQLEGLRLLLTPFPQQQFNATEDRRAELPSQGAACFDCHSNGHQNGTTHLAPDTRPQQFRHRLKTISLRGLNIQRLFGSQRALKTVEDFTEFEQRTAYFDGDHVIAAKKGVNPLERGSQVDFMADFEEMLDFPPAPKLDILGKLDPAKATPAEMRGQEIFFGKGECSSCHQPPFYTDNLMHDLRTERFFKPVMINNMMAVGDGPIKTFALRGVKDNPPYMHDERLLTLEDTVEFFNLILGTKLQVQEKQDLVAFLRALYPVLVTRKCRRVFSAARVAPRANATAATVSRPRAFGEAQSSMGRTNAKIWRMATGIRHDTACRRGLPTGGCLFSLRAAIPHGVRERGCAATRCVPWVYPRSCRRAARPESHLLAQNRRAGIAPRRRQIPPREAGKPATAGGLFGLAVASRRLSLHDVNMVSAGAVRRGNGG
jgi:cytochrome c peroxidase